MSIDELCVRITSGGTPSRERPEYFCTYPDGFPWVKSQELIDRRISTTGERISDAGMRGSSAKVLPRATVLVAMYGATVGQLGYLDVDAAVNQAICALITDPVLVNSRFLYYALMHCRGELVMHAQGAAQQNLSQQAIRPFRLRVPDVVVQNQIAAILDTLDDFIENNRRRVQLLAEMVRAIYREWFVSFRYPTHEGAALVDSALGPIPTGWELSTCGQQLIALGGGTPSKSVSGYWDEGSIPWFTPSDLTKAKARYTSASALKISRAGLANSSARLFPAGSVLMTSRATLGVLAIATTEGTTNQGFIVLPPDDRWPPSFMYEWLSTRADELASVATGATFKEITKGAFKQVLFLVPDQGTLGRYRAATDPIEHQIRNLEEQGRSLAALRDMLLPKLVTGQIGVSSFDPDSLVSEAAS